MTVSYYDLCKNRQLNEVVLMGSHDAAIATGGANGMTQTLDILAQAEAGARFFDMRVAAFRTSTLGGKVELRAYHDAMKMSSPTLRGNDRMKVADLGNQKRNNVKVHTTTLGEKGFGLQAMLQDAFAFLRDNDQEFLIFKFDKSENWALIHEVCEQEFQRAFADSALTRNYAYQSPNPTARNLNELEVRQLAGKLVILFPASAFAAIGASTNQTADDLHAAGYLKWKNLYAKSETSATQYDAAFQGLQYYGKGGVSASGSGDTGKIDLNTAKQGALMQGQGDYKRKKDGWRGKVGQTDKGTHAGADPNAIGLMYWTTTGPSWSGILERNKKMWKPAVRQQMMALGLQNADPSLARLGNGAAGNAVKPFMPNIIMVDFVDPKKGQVIHSMNFDSGSVIAQELQRMDESVYGEDAMSV